MRDQDQGRALLARNPRKPMPIPIPTPIPAARRLALVVESLAIAALVLAIALMVSIAGAFAAEAPAASPAAFTTPNEATTGSLLLKGTEEGRYVEAPRLETDATLTVSGPTIRAR